MKFQKNNLSSIAWGLLFLPLAQGYSLTNPLSRHANWLFVRSEGSQLVFDYKSPVIALVDSKKLNSVGIKVKLPLGLIKNTIVDNCLSFYYPNRQAVIILPSKNAKRDTLFTANRKQLIDYISSIPISGGSENSINEKKIYYRRKSMIIVINGYEVLLYNIKDSSLQDFTSKVLTLQTY